MKESKGNYTPPLNLTNTTSNRNFLFDNIKALLIYFVVIGHLINSAVPHSIFTSIYYFIYLFHMPAFIWVSGYLSKNVEKCRETAFEKLFIPYILLNIISFIEVFIMRQFIAPTQLAPINPDLTEQVIKDGLPVFRFFIAPFGCWFLLALFIWRFFLKDIVRIRYILPLSILFGLLAGFSNEFSKFMSLGRIAAYSWFFLLGFFMNETHIEKIRRIPKIISVIILALSGYLAYLFSTTKFMPRSSLLARAPYRNEFEIIDFFNRLILYVLAFLIIIAIINLMSTKKTWFSIIGQNTMTVYMLHLLIARITDELVLFKGQPILYGIFIFGSAALITFLFSRPIVNSAYEAFLNWICKLIFKKPKNN